MIGQGRGLKSGLTQLPGTEDQPLSPGVCVHVCVCVCVCVCVWGGGGGGDDRERHLELTC